MITADQPNSSKFYEKSTTLRIELDILRCLRDIWGNHALPTFAQVSAIYIH